MTERMSFEQIEDWRFDKHKGRPQTDYRSFSDASRPAERDPILPEHLFRQVPAEDLFLIWRDKEMPLQVFEGSGHSQVDANSIGNFWFTKPLEFSDIEAYVVTKPSEWKDKPEFVQESFMSFKSDKKLAELGEWANWRPHAALSHVPEVHTGNRVKLEDMTIFISPNTREMFEEELTELRARNNSRREQVLHRVGKIFEREHVEPEKASKSGYSKWESIGKKQLADSAFKESLMNFYKWALELPVLTPEAWPKDVEYETQDPKEVNEKQFGKFMKFYKKYKNETEKNTDNRPSGSSQKPTKRKLK